MKAQPKAKTQKEREFDENARITTMAEECRSKRRDKRERINGY